MLLPTEATGRIDQLHREQNWFTIIREFLNQLQYSLHIESVETITPIPLQENDNFLMDDVGEQRLDLLQKTMFDPLLRFKNSHYAVSVIYFLNDPNDFLGHVDFKLLS